MRGVPLPAVQALMGHSTVQMTMKYSHLAPDHLRSAIAALIPAAPKPLELSPCHTDVPSLENPEETR